MIILLLVLRKKKILLITQPVHYLVIDIIEFLSILKLNLRRKLIK
jgi:hypothetical protein